MSTAIANLEPATRALDRRADSPSRIQVLRKNVVALFALDLRSLALFRISLAVMVIVDLILRAADLEAHYSDNGVLPRSASSSGWTASLHRLSGAVWFEGMLFIFAGLFALMLMVGYRTRLANVVCCFLTISLIARNHLAGYGADVLLRVLLFWGMFLPLGARWSIDALRRDGDAPPSSRIVSIATAALILQVCFVYWFSTALKYHPIWFEEGSAVFFALHIDQMVTPLGARLRENFELTRILTFSTLIVEAVGPALLFIPFRQSAIRLCVVVCFLLFHLFGLVPLQVLILG